MPDEPSAATIRAAVEAILPPDEEFPGAAALGVGRHVVEAMEMALPGSADLAARLLDGFAGEVGARFADLDPAGRSRILRAMCTDEGAEVREIAESILLFTLGGTYSEWTGFDRTARELHTPPAVWSEIGYHGPVVAHPDYRDGL